MYRSQIEHHMELHSELQGQFNFIPQLIFNIDETFLFPGVERVKLYTSSEKGVATATNSNLEHITIFLAISASGDAMKPLCILPLVNLPENLPETVTEYFNFSGQKNGWINSAIYRDWIENDFVAEVERVRAKMNKPNAPALLLSDGHSTRQNIPAVKALEANNIHTIIAPAHSSTILQPLDLTVNGEFKRLLAKNFKKVDGETNDVSIS